MKRLTCLFLLSAVCGCSDKMNIKYENTVNNGCEYSESWRPRKFLFDYFGCRDSDLQVNYAGVKCETIINKELKDNIHTPPYNGLPVANEMPPLKIEVEQ